MSEYRFDVVKRYIEDAGINHSSVMKDYSAAYIDNDQGGGDFTIRKWEVAGLSQPTIAQLDALEAVMFGEYLARFLPAYRYEKEVGGITVGGTEIQTDRVSRGNLTAAYIKAKEDANYSLKWKTENGFVDLTAAQIISIADAVEAHVQACFVAEANIDTSSLDTNQDVENAFDAAYALAIGG